MALLRCDITLFMIINVGYWELSGNIEECIIDNELIPRNIFSPELKYLVKVLRWMIPYNLKKLKTTLKIAKTFGKKAKSKKIVCRISSLSHVCQWLISWGSTKIGFCSEIHRLQHD